jgi:hypothetical protein
MGWSGRFRAGWAARRGDDNDGFGSEVAEMNARQRRQAAEFVAAGGSFETYSPWDRLKPVLSRLVDRSLRRTVRPAVGRWPW